MNTVTRFAPSPTGLFHAGSYRTALFAYIFAKKSDGKFILRIEDTDKERSKKEYEDNIIESLNWLGLKHDEFWRQSERTAVYKKYLERLISSGHAYVSDEMDPEGTKRKQVIRFKNPNIKVKFQDLVRGEIEFDTTELKDFVIAKSMEEPIFHLVNVIDDYEMGVTHIIRGEDHISNTPRQILIFKAIGADIPVYAHIPLLLAKDRSKLSKRHGALSMTEYKKKGYLPAALVNYMCLLGWHPTDDREIMTFEEIIRDFSIDRVQKSGAIFDEEKLAWFNRQYILKLSDEEFMEQARNFFPEDIRKEPELIKKLTPLLKSKISVFSDIEGIFKEELRFIRNEISYNPDMLLVKKNPDRSTSKIHLAAVEKIIKDIRDDRYEPEEIKRIIFDYAEKNGKAEVLWPLRVALTGQDRSPDPFVSAYILGKEKSIERIEKAIKSL